MTQRTSPTVLIIDDEAGILETLRILLKNEGFTPVTALGGKAGLDALETSIARHRAQRHPDADDLGHRGPGRGASARDPQLPVVLMTAQASMQSAIQAVNEGAFYYIQKPFRNDELVAILRRAAEHRQLKIENVTLKQEIQRRDRQQCRQQADGQQPVMAEGAGDGGNGRADRFDGADHRRVGNGQGSDRAVPARPVAARRQQLHVDQLWRASGIAARKRAVRPREGVVHRRREGQARGCSPRPTRERSFSMKSARRRRRRR